MYTYSFFLKTLFPTSSFSFFTWYVKTITSSARIPSTRKLGQLSLHSSRTLLLRVARIESARQRARIQIQHAVLLLNTQLVSSAIDHYIRLVLRLTEDSITTRRAVASRRESVD